MVMLAEDGYLTRVYDSELTSYSSSYLKASTSNSKSIPIKSLTNALIDNVSPAFSGMYEQLACPLSNNEVK